MGLSTIDVIGDETVGGAAVRRQIQHDSSWVAERQQRQRRRRRGRRGRRRHGRAWCPRHRCRRGGRGASTRCGGGGCRTTGTCVTSDRQRCDDADHHTAGHQHDRSHATAAIPGRTEQRAPVFGGVFGGVFGAGFGVTDLDLDGRPVVFVLQPTHAVSRWPSTHARLTTSGGNPP